MSEHETETAFLRHLILYDDSDERRELDEGIARVRRDTRCVQRAASVTALFALLAIAGFAYGALLQTNFPYNGSDLVLRALCVLGLASVICLVGFAGLLTAYFRELHRLQKKARQLVIKLLKARLGDPHIASLPARHRVFDSSVALQGATELSGEAGSI